MCGEFAFVVKIGTVHGDFQHAANQFHPTVDGPSSHESTTLLTSGSNASVTPDGLAISTASRTHAAMSCQASGVAVVRMMFHILMRRACRCRGEFWEPSSLHAAASTPIRRTPPARYSASGWHMLNVPCTDAINSGAAASRRIRAITSGGIASGSAPGRRNPSPIGRNPDRRLSRRPALLQRLAGEDGEEDAESKQTGHPSRQVRLVRPMRKVRKAAPAVIVCPPS